MARTLFTAAALAAAFLLLPVAAQSQPADLIVINAKIATLDATGTTAQALAVREGRIVAVGTG